MGKNPPASVGDMDSIPDKGGSHTLLEQLLSLCSRAWEIQLLRLHALEPQFHNNRNLCNEKPSTITENSLRESSFRFLQLEKKPEASAQPEIN